MHPMQGQGAHAADKQLPCVRGVSKLWTDKQHALAVNDEGAVGGRG